MVALDANVLVPIVACDLLLTAFERGLFDPVVSTLVPEEVERSLLVDFPSLDATAVRFRVASMEDALKDQLIEPTDWMVPSSINTKDHHVVEAAVMGEAAAIVTNDIDLRSQVAAALPIAAQSLDEFGIGLLRSSPESFSLLIDQLVAKRVRRPVSRGEMMQSLAAHIPTAIRMLKEEMTGP